MALRVLVVGHAYMVVINRKKWEEMARIFGAKIRIVVPKVWDDALFTLTAEPPPPQGLVEVAPIKTFFCGNEPKYFYSSMGMGMRKFMPDILHVEQGATALSYFQALLLKQLFARKAKAVFFTWVNNNYPVHFPFNYFQCHNLRHSDGAIAGNQDAKVILEESGFKKPIVVIPQLGVDPDEFKKCESSPLKARVGRSPFVVGFVGSLGKHKGVLGLLEAASRLSGEWSLLFLGKGALGDELKRRAIEKGMEKRVVFVDPVPNKDVAGYINCMDVLVLPSLTTPTEKEQFGHVLIEAMACEVPVIGSTAGEIPHVIGDAGIIFPEGDVERLSMELARLKDDPGLRERIGTKGRERVIERYTHTRIAEETYGFYQKILNPS